MRSHTLKKEKNAADILRLQRLLIEDQFLPDDFKMGIHSRIPDMDRDQIIYVSALLEDMQRSQKQVLDSATDKMREIKKELEEQEKKLLSANRSRKKNSLIDAVRKKLQL